MSERTKCWAPSARSRRGGLTRVTPLHGSVMFMCVVGSGDSRKTRCRESIGARGRPKPEWRLAEPSPAILLHSTHGLTGEWPWWRRRARPLPVAPHSVSGATEAARA